MNKYLFWLIPLVLFFLQFVMTFNSLNQIRYEEIEESISNPFFVQNRYVANGAAANVGWHFLMVAVYNFLGSSLFAGKFVRLFLFAMSLVCLSVILRRFLGEKRAIIPLVTIGFSPTLLYFNTQQTVYGLDLVYFPICLFILLTIKFERTILDYSRQILFGGFLMFGWLSYPSFIYFWPPLFGFYFWRLLFRHPRQTRLANDNLLVPFLIPIISFFIPLIGVFLYIKNRNLLIWDENVRSGIFRGAGFLQFDLSTFYSNLSSLVRNLFLSPSGYYYELAKAEFGDFYPVIGVVLVIFLTLKIWKEKRSWRPMILFVVSILVLNIILGFFTLDSTPGMRRYGGVLVSFYILFILVWKYVLDLKKSGKRVFLILGLLVLGLYHLIVFPINLGHIGDPSRFAERLWFGRDGDPQAAFSMYLVQVQSQDLTFMCRDESGKGVNCSYSGPYTAISGACLWNKLSCRDIYGWDIQKNDFIKLELDLFRSYYFGQYGKEVKAL